MWRLVIVAVLIACKGGSSAPDAAWAPPCPCAVEPANIPPCGFATCGNGIVDTCFVRSPMGCHCVTVVRETCETTKCESLGFYGNAIPCSANCQFVDPRRCNACAPENIVCRVNVIGEPPQQLAASASHIAVATPSNIAIFDGSLNVQIVVAPNARDLVAVPTGWLVVTATARFHLDRAGTIGMSIAGTTTDPAAAYGAGGNVGIAWAQNGAVRFTIVTTTGVEVIAGSDLFTGSKPSAASDGTSFFVGAAGQLARIAADGTRTIATGFPLRANERVYVVNGWYASVVGNSLVGQRFDASGAVVGTAITVDLGGPILDLVADGTDLVVLRRTGHIELVRVSSAGTMSAPREVGGGDPVGQLDHMGTSFAVSWGSVSQLEIALATPP
jgi:hypothetical protein